MLTYRVDGAVAWAEISRPAKLNAMLPVFWDELRAVLGRVEDDPAVRVLVIHGAGRCFSVGGDIAGFGELTDLPGRRAYIRSALDALRAVERMGKPTIAAVHGQALGGGCELTLVSDIVVADETARFGMPEAAVGLVPGLGVVRGTAQLNLHWLKYMVMTGESLDAEQARLAGLVNTVVPEGQHLAEAQRLAQRIATRAPLALQVGKAIIGRHSEEGYAHGTDAVSLLLGGSEVAEGIAAFVDRRHPEFPDA